jgi:hypothetical protein
LIPIKKAFQVDPYQTMRGWLSGMLIEAPALISRLFCRAMDLPRLFDLDTRRDLIIDLTRFVPPFLMQRLSKKKT